MKQTIKIHWSPQGLLNQRIRESYYKTLETSVNSQLSSLSLQIYAKKELNNLVNHPSFIQITSGYVQRGL